MTTTLPAWTVVVRPTRKIAGFHHATEFRGQALGVVHADDAKTADAKARAAYGALGNVYVASMASWRCMTAAERNAMLGSDLPVMPKDRPKRRKSLTRRAS